MIKGLFALDQRQRHRGSAREIRAFSLVEVVLALGVAAFAILTIVALLPVGIKSSKDSVDETRAQNVANEVIADRQITPFGVHSTIYNLPALTNTVVIPVTNSFGVMSDNTMTSSLSQAVFKVTCIMTPPAPDTLNPYQLYVDVSWPAASTGVHAGSVETIATFPQP